jgi:hypothetical protein
LYAFAHVASSGRQVARRGASDRDTIVWDQPRTSCHLTDNFVVVNTPAQERADAEMFVLRMDGAPQVDKSLSSAMKRYAKTGSWPRATWSTIERPTS